MRCDRGAPDASALGHTPISGPEGNLRLFGGMRGRTPYTHANCTNPILDARAPEAAHVRAGGAEIASDGIEIAL